MYAQVSYSSEQISHPSSITTSKVQRHFLKQRYVEMVIVCAPRRF